MPIPIYVICKAKGSTITSVGCEIPKIEGKQVLQGNIHCQFEKIGGIFHYHFRIKAENLYIGPEKLYFHNRSIEIQVNVRSHEGRKTPKLEYLFKEDFRSQDAEKFSFDELQKLEYGIKIFNYEQEENKGNRIALDYIRSNLFSVNEFNSVPSTSDLNKELHKYITEAKKQNADIYIFGDLYTFESKENEKREEKLIFLKEHGPKGIHDIHMNQGNCFKKQWIENSDVYQDGGLLIHFNSDMENRWIGIFLKFESQCTKTHDETGYCL